MTLEEFKNIFYWEWSHRMIGRFIGMSFVLPGLYFASRGYMSKRVMKQTFGISCLLGFQVNKKKRKRECVFTFLSIRVSWVGTWSSRVFLKH